MERCENLGEVGWLIQSTLQILQLAIALSMLILAVDWVLGDGSQGSWIAVLGVMMTVIQLVQRRICE
jgi:hypothetical protein